MFAGFYPNSRCLNPIFWHEKWHVSEAAKGQRTAETGSRKEIDQTISKTIHVSQNWGHVSIAFHGFAWLRLRCAKEKAEGFDEVKFLWDAAPKCGWTFRSPVVRSWDCYVKFVDCQIRPDINLYISYYKKCCAHFLGGIVITRWYRK